MVDYIILRNKMCPLFKLVVILVESILKTFFHKSAWILCSLLQQPARENMNLPNTNAQRPQPEIHSATPNFSAPQAVIF